MAGVDAKRVSPGVAAAMVALVSLAGCAESGGGDEPQEDAISIADEFEATEETGVVLGVVVDETIRPVPDAVVTLRTSPPQETTSNEDGEFGFGGVAPGTYVVEAQRLGYVAAQASVQVEAGTDRPDVVNLVVAIDEANQPYVQAFQFEGFVQCGMNYVAVCGVGPFLGTLLCTQYDICVGNITNDQFIAFHEIDGPPDWVQSEMVWRSTQSLSDELTMILSYGAREQFNEGFIEGNLNRSTGPSPIYATINKTVAQNESVALGVDNHLVPRVFSGSIPASRQCVPNPATGGQNCVSFGFTIEQRFTIFTHIFYAYQPPLDWRFSQSNDVPGP